jgi:hypothetical protein
LNAFKSEILKRGTNVPANPKKQNENKTYSLYLLILLKVFGVKEGAANKLQLPANPKKQNENKTYSLYIELPS